MPVDRAAAPDDGLPGRRPRGSVDAGTVLDHLADAVVVADSAGTIALANRAAERLLGYPEGQLVGQPLITMIPGRFRPQHLAGFERFLTTGENHAVGGPALRIMARRSDGSEVPVALALAAVQRSGDADLLVVGSLRDVSQRVALEEQAVLSRLLQATVDASRDGVLAVSPDRRVLAVNRRFCELWHLPADSIRVGDSSAAFAQGALWSQIVDLDAFEAAIKWGRDHPSESQVVDVELADGRRLAAYTAPIVGMEGEYHGRVWYLHDDTERRMGEARLADAERAQRFLLDAAGVLSASVGSADTLRALAEVAVPTLGDLCLIDVLAETGQLTRVAAVHALPDAQPLADQLFAYPPAPGGMHPSAQAIRGRKSHLGELDEEFLRSTTRDASHQRLALQLGLTGYMAVPLVADGEALGALTVMAANSGRRYDTADLALAEDLAARVAAVVAKERRYEQQRSLAHTLQASLLPSVAPAVAGIEVAVRYIPATNNAEVGGDFWDVMPLDDGAVALAIGDVVGHDMIAAATMAQLRSAARALRTSAMGPDQLIASLHAAWPRLGLERGATALFARFQPSTGVLRMASAGHPPPLMVSDGRAWYLPVEPAPLLGGPPEEARLYELLWPEGAVLVLYTDGLIEDRHTCLDDSLLELQSVAAGAPATSADAVADHLLHHLVTEDRKDDVALLVVRRLDSGGG